MHSKRKQQRKSREERMNADASSMRHERLCSFLVVMLCCVVACACVCVCVCVCCVYPVLSSGRCSCWRRHPVEVLLGCEGDSDAAAGELMVHHGGQRRKRQRREGGRERGERERERGRGVSAGRGGDGCSGARRCGFFFRRRRCCRCCCRLLLCQRLWCRCALALGRPTSGVIRHHERVGASGSAARGWDGWGCEEGSEFESSVRAVLPKQRRAKPRAGTALALGGAQQRENNRCDLIQQRPTDLLTSSDFDLDVSSRRYQPYKLASLFWETLLVLDTAICTPQLPARANVVLSSRLTDPSNKQLTQHAARASDESFAQQTTLVRARSHQLALHSQTGLRSSPSVFQLSQPDPDEKPKKNRAGEIRLGLYFCRSCEKKKT